MKVVINQIPPEGLNLEQDLLSSDLDLQTDIVKFTKPIKVKATLYRITNAVCVNLGLSAVMHTNCSRCLNELDIDFKKNLQLSYPVNKLTQVIELNPDIREEIILDYPMKPLCQPDCKGLCPKCGKNLNEGGCSCATT